MLTITGYTGDDHDGIYVCRTENIAGRDSAIVALSSSQSVLEGVDLLANHITIRMHVCQYLDVLDVTYCVGCTEDFQIFATAKAVT